jgi:glutamyl-tRNA synthetase
MPVTKNTPESPSSKQSIRLYFVVTFESENSLHETAFFFKFFYFFCSLNILTMNSIRVRFAPSPTGALHIGGIRTALYNFLLARKTGGVFILRIEDTDQGRFVPGAEAYIIESLQWAGIIPDEGPGFGGAHGPYRQSERKAIYWDYAVEMVKNGKAYYAFDTPEELEAARAVSNHAFKYDASVRGQMSNSLNTDEQEVLQRIASGTPYVIRLKVEPGQEIHVQDKVRGEVTFRSDELDDKILMKSDGMPTYHLANVVDDRLMEITHVIRGEEWLPSTAHHVLLYRALGWEDKMPAFAHLPLILKPDGKGKLSKRDGLRLGIPVFPIAWQGATPEESFKGFREFGFLPEAMLNFMAFLGWNPGTDQEIFSLDELIDAFSIEKIGKSGARFDFDKACWFNQQYIQALDVQKLADLVRPILAAHGIAPEQHFLYEFCRLMKDRVTLLPEFLEKGAYFFSGVSQYDQAVVQKKWNPENKAVFHKLASQLEQQWQTSPDVLKSVTEGFMAEQGLKAGDVLSMLRIALAGNMQGPAVFEMMAVLGCKESISRLVKAFDIFDLLIERQS